MAEEEHSWKLVRCKSTLDESRVLRFHLIASALRNPQIEYPHRHALHLLEGLVLMLLHSHNWRSGVDVEITFEVFVGKLYYLAHCLMGAKHTLKNEVVRQPYLDEGRHGDGLFYQMLELYLPLVFESRRVSAVQHELLPVLLQYRVLFCFELLFQCHLLYRVLSFLILFVIDPGMSVSWRVAHLLFSVSYQLIEQLLVIFFLAIPILRDHIGHHTRTVEGRLVWIVHHFSALQDDLQVSPATLQMADVGL